MRAAPNPRTLTGWSGASPHVLRFPPRAFLRFPVCPPGPSPSSAFFWFPFVRRSPVCSLRPLPGFRFPFGFPPGSLPLSNLHVSAAVRRFRRRWSQAAGTKVTSPAATTSPGSRDPPALQMGSGWARWDVATESPVTSGRERRTSPRPDRPDRRLCARLRPRGQLRTVSRFAQLTRRWIAESGQPGRRSSQRRAHRPLPGCVHGALPPDHQESEIGNRQVRGRCPLAHSPRVPVRVVHGLCTRRWPGRRNPVGALPGLRALCVEVRRFEAVIDSVTGCSCRTGTLALRGTLDHTAVDRDGW